MFNAAISLARSGPHPGGIAAATAIRGGAAATWADTGVHIGGKATPSPVKSN